MTTTDQTIDSSPILGDTHVTPNIGGSMETLFTRSSYPASKLIMAVTGEPMSHCAIKYGNLVLHCNFTGFQIERYDDFLKHSIIVGTRKAGHSVPCSDILEVIRVNLGRRYDWKAFFYLGIRQILKSLGLPSPKVELTGISGLYICTEFVYSVTIGKPDTLLTPYQLYMQLDTKDSES